MKRKLLLAAGILTVLGVSTYGAEGVTDEQQEEKKISFSTGIQHTERQQGRMT